MNIDQGLVFGVFLILAGAILAIFAYLAFSSKDPVPPISLEDEELDQDDSESLDSPSGGDVEELEDERVEKMEPEVQSSAMLAAASAEMVSHSSTDQQIPSEHPSTLEQGVPEKETSSFEAPPSPAVTPHPPRIQVATLLRDEVTGNLIVQVGDTEFSDPDELRNSPYWTRVEFAALDLSKWVGQKEEKTVASAPRMRESDTTPVRPQSMIGQINDILQQNIAKSGGKYQGVQLIEGPGGSARVMVGVQSYELGEVPDENIQALIRDAVATWEKTQ
jgi:hypothetical protein